METPDELRYTTDHEWARSEAGNIRVGITDFAQESLGDVVFVDLPSVGAQVEAGSVLGEVESTKSVSEIYSPVSGHISAINEGLISAPEMLNSEPYGSGWFCCIEPADIGEFEGLLTAEQYRALITD